MLAASRAHELSHAMRRPYRFAAFGSELPLVLCLAPDLSFVKASAAPAEPPDAVRAFAVMGDQDEPETRDGFEAAVAECADRGLRISSATWAGDHAMPPAGDVCYDAMVAHLFPPPAAKQPVDATSTTSSQLASQPAAAAGAATPAEDDDLADLGF